MDNFDIVKEFFVKLGYLVLEKPNPSDNCCDLTVVGKKSTLRVEIKTLRVREKGQWCVEPVTENQKKYDAVAVVLPNNQVFLEPMEEYLNNSSPNGYRQFTWLNLDGY